MEQFDIDAFLQNGTLPQLWPSELNVTREYQVFVEHVTGFVNTVDWSERWLQALLAAHVICFLIILLGRNNMRVQTVLFCTLCEDPMLTLCAKAAF
jgi:hypothetical protein